MPWWVTSIYNRAQELTQVLQKKGRKFTKFETAYSDFNWGLGNAKCQNCYFYQNGQCAFVDGQINPNGLCHAITSKDPNKPFKIEYYYNKIYTPPNGITVYYIIGAGLLYFGLYKLFDKKKKY